jgi:hypothetical protein
VLLIVGGRRVREARFQPGPPVGVLASQVPLSRAHRVDRVGVPVADEGVELRVGVDAFERVER